MDLDQLKDIWKELDEPAGQHRGQEEIAAMLKKRSQGPIARMKRNLRWELILVIVSYSVIITHYFYSFEEELHSVAWFLLTIAALFLLYYYFKNKLLNEMQQVSGQVKVHLERQVTALEKFVRIYLIAGSALVPICLAFFGWIFYKEIQDPANPNVFFGGETWKTILSWAGLTLVLTTIVYFANVWLLKKLYGDNIRKLKEIIREMSEE